MPRKRRSLLGASEGQPAPAPAAPAVRERTTPVTEAIPRRTLTPPPTEPAPASSPTPPTRDRVSGDWFLASGQSPPERTASGEEPVVAPAPRNPWLWAAPIAGVAAVGLLFVLALVLALVLF